MDQRTEPIRQDIDALRDSMTDKMSQIEAKVKSTVDGTTETVKRAFDIKGQAAERPWAAVGLSVLAGYVLGSMGSSSEGHAASTRLDPRNTSSMNDYMRYVSSDPSKGPYSTPEMYQGSHTGDTGEANSYQPSHSQATYGYPSYTEPTYSQASYTQPAHSQASYTQPAHSQASYTHQNKSSQPGMLDSILGQFGGELDTLKSAAVSAVIGMLRETIQQSIPQFSREYERVLRERESSQTSSSSSSTNSSTGYAGSSASSSSYDMPSTSSSYTSATGADSSGTERSIGSGSDYDYRSPGPKL